MDLFFVDPIEKHEVRYMFIKKHWQKGGGGKPNVNMFWANIHTPSFKKCTLPKFGERTPS